MYLRIRLIKMDVCWVIWCADCAARVGAERTPAKFTAAALCDSCNWLPTGLQRAPLSFIRAASRRGKQRRTTASRKQDEERRRDEEIIKRNDSNWSACVRASPRYSDKGDGAERPTRWTRSVTDVSTSPDGVSIQRGPCLVSRGTRFVINLAFKRNPHVSNQRKLIADWPFFWSIPYSCLFMSEPITCE